MRKTKRNFKGALGGALTDGKWQRWKAVGTTSVAIMATLGVAVVNPVGVALADWQTGSSGDLPSGAQVDLNAYNEIQSEVTLTMDASSENGKLNASAAETNPDVAADVVKRTATVGLTNTSGYTVKIRGDSTNLTGVSTSNTIPSVTTATTLGQMTNAWGWNGSIGDTATDCSLAGTFKQMTTSDQELGSGGAESSATKKVTICFGARVDGTKAADAYSNTVTLSVVAQPGKVATFDGIAQMQQMTPAICKAADINDTAQLEDVRDGKKYWVTKLLDGNCWMSQNLALDLESTVIATYNDNPAQTFVWTVGSDGGMASITQSNTFGNTYKYAWSLGNYVIVDPVASTACAENNAGLGVCSEQFIAVEDRVPSTDPNFYKSHGAKTYTDTEYDAHYLVGNHYQWNAATAGTGGTISDYARASGSICPKNWKMPDNAYTNDTTIKSGSYGYLLQQYGLMSTWDNGNVAGTSEANGNAYNIALSPLFFVRSGTVDPLNHRFRGGGYSAYYWSSRAASEATYSPYFLSFYTNNDKLSLNNSINYDRYDGSAVRCLVQSL